MVISGNKGGDDVKHSRCQQDSEETEDPRTVTSFVRSRPCRRMCVEAFVNICMSGRENTANERVCLPGNMSMSVFGLPSVPQQRPSKLFSRSLATLIVSRPPQSINQPSTAPLNPQTGAEGCVCMCKLGRG